MAARGWFASSGAGSRPDQTVAFDGGVGPQVQLGVRRAIVAMCGHLDAAAAGTETDAVIGTGDRRAVARAQAQRRSSMGAQIGGDDHVVTGAIDDERFIEQHHADWPRRHFA
jgi:hypothetical protein